MIFSPPILKKQFLKISAQSESSALRSVKLSAVERPLAEKQRPMRDWEACDRRRMMRSIYRAHRL